MILYYYIVTTLYINLSMFLENFMIKIKYFSIMKKAFKIIKKKKHLKR